MLEEINLHLMLTSSNDLRRENMGTHHPSKEQGSSRKNKNGKEYVIHHMQEQKKKNMWVREKTMVTDMVEQVRRRKWTWAGHVSRIRDNRWTLYHHLETLRKEKTEMKTGETMERRTRRLMEGYHLAEDSAR